MLQMMINYVYRVRNFEHLEMRCRTIAAHELAIKSNLQKCISLKVEEVKESFKSLTKQISLYYL